MPSWLTDIARFLGTETADMRKGRLAHERGIRAERRVAEALRQEGWLVKLSPGSRGVYDIEAFRSGERIFIQVKSGYAWPTDAQIASLAKKAARKRASAFIFHESRGSILAFPVCRWCCHVGEPRRRKCARCGQPF